MKTTQEIFDTVARHLLTQKARSECLIDFDGEMAKGCAYRTPDGLMCAVGCLIPDDLYDPIIENVAVQGVMAVAKMKDTAPSYVKLFNILVELGMATDDKMKLLSNLQRTHDQCPPDQWRQALRNIAINRGLSPAVLDDFPLTPESASL